ncbi:hypothetical protein NHX12_020287 [Muraenolepis orangiensis]|uniref:Uncharacterized protein n=1 Tax=Muraenolepis orangiensis TaxID=630683 RepID=A0A9Q0ET75_9TELE|nr:hypothetical protein NHX12_020287 [Muraenolepis orangiensis]
MVVSWSVANANLVHATDRRTALSSWQKSPEGTIKQLFDAEFLSRSDCGTHDSNCTQSPDVCSPGYQRDGETPEASQTDADAEDRSAKVIPDYNHQWEPTPVNKP